MTIEKLTTEAEDLKKEVYRLQAERNNALVTLEILTARVNQAVTNMESPMFYAEAKINVQSIVADLRAATKITESAATEYRKQIESEALRIAQTAEPVTVQSAKLVVMKAALGICALEELALFQRLEDLWVNGFLAGQRTPPSSNHIAERKRQDIKWGGATHDDTHTTVDFLCYLLERICLAGDSERANAREQTRRRLIQVSALAVAAVESFDRKVTKTAQEKI